MASPPLSPLANDDAFHASWRRLWAGLGGASDGAATRDAVLAAYAQPHRYYHSRLHLQECLRLFDTVQLLPQRPAEVEAALWFHDAVYELRASDNEVRSARWARDALHAGGVSAAAADRVHDLVLATQHAAMPAGIDEQVLVDIDLSILGASDERFAQYEQQIRQEYAHVPDALFALKRREVLQSFLDRPAIYSTPLLQRQFEARARANLVRAIGQNAAPSA